MVRNLGSNASLLWETMGIERRIRSALGVYFGGSWLPGRNDLNTKQATKAYLGLLLHRLPRTIRLLTVVDSLSDFSRKLRQYRTIFAIYST